MIIFKNIQRVEFLLSVYVCVFFVLSPDTTAIVVRARANIVCVKEKNNNGVANDMQSREEQESRISPWIRRVERPSDWLTQRDTRVPHAQGTRDIIVTVFFSSLPSDRRDARGTTRAKVVGISLSLTRN